MAVEDERLLGEDLPDFEEDLKRAYVARVVVQRLHQQSFRRRVLRAYRERCSVCRLKHAELLDAAHILPDSDPRGEPVVANGLAHHGQGGVRVSAPERLSFAARHPRWARTVRGPRTRPPTRNPDSESRATSGHPCPDPTNHGLKEMDGGKLYVPRSAVEKPRREFLEMRYEQFRKAG